MIRIKIWKWTQLLYYFLVIVLAAVIIGLAIRYLSLYAASATNANLYTSQLRSESLMFYAGSDPPIQTMGFFPSDQDAGFDLWQSIRQFFISWGESFSRRVLSYAYPAIAAGEAVKQPDARVALVIEEEPAASSEPAEFRDVPLPMSVTAPSPRIILYATHSREAYEKQPDQDYIEVSAWRTDDVRYNVLGVGAELSLLLRAQYMIPVLQDMTNHEPPVHGTAYIRSLETIQRLVKQYPNQEMVIDVHRDAYPESGKAPRALEADGKSYAQMMFVVGTGEGQTGAGFSIKPDWQANLKLAQRLTAEINKLMPGLCKPVAVRTGRYNQHVTDHSLLVEVGHNKNTYEEAINSMPYLARAIAIVLNESGST